MRGQEFEMKEIARGRPAGAGSTTPTGYPDSATVVASLRAAEMESPCSARDIDLPQPLNQRPTIETTTVLRTQRKRSL